MKRGLYFLCLVLAGCGGSSDKNTDTATSGEVTLSADESLRPIVEAEAAVFEGIYPHAKLNIIYTNEFDAIEMVCKDSARMAIITRDLLPEEKAWFERAKITPRYSYFAYDAITVLLNRENKDTVFTLSQLAKMMDGTYTKWKDLEPGLPNEDIRVVFDHPKSGIVRFMKDSLLNGHEPAKNCFAVESNEAVIDYVEKNKNAVGLIGVAWISDRDDSLMHSFTERIRVASLVPKVPETAEADKMKPYQAYIALKQYPLWRKVQILSREARVGLGTGFASFIASDRGQRIVLKAGLVPAQAPLRLVNIKKEAVE